MKTILLFFKKLFKTPSKEIELEPTDYNMAHNYWEVHRNDSF